MGRFVYWMNTSLDLFIGRTAGEDGGGEWLRIGEELHREFNARAAGLSLMVEGRVIYEIMEPYWPVVAIGLVGLVVTGLTQTLNVAP